MAIGPALRRASGAFLSWLPATVRDAVGVAGLGSVAFGCWRLAPSAGLIVGGLEAVAICLLLTAAGRR